MKVRLFLIILFYLFVTRSFSQIDSATIFKQKTLEGYFVCYRDTIEKTPPDMVLPRYDFTIFFFNKLDDSVLLSLKTMKLSKTGFTVISGGYNYLIAESKPYKQYLQYLKTNDLDNKAYHYGIFNFSKVDEDLIASNKSLISIFKGLLKRQY